MIAHMAALEASASSAEWVFVEAASVKTTKDNEWYTPWLLLKK